MRNLKTWWNAVRPFSFTVSILPPVLGALAAVIENTGLKFHWPHFFIVLSGCMFAHSGSNLLSDYYDYKNRVDRPGTLGSSGVLVEKLMTPAQVRLEAFVFFALAAAIGIYFILTLEKGRSLLWLVLIGAILGFFYTAGPVKLKYRALGDLAVFIAFGPAMSLGAYFVLTQRLSWAPIYYVLPLAFLVDAILHSNNIRDIENDKVANISTLAMKLGERRAILMYTLLLAAAYVSTLTLVLMRVFPWYALLVLLSVPISLKLMRQLKDKSEGERGRYYMIDARTAQFHSAFGILLVIALMIRWLTR